MPCESGALLNAMSQSNDPLIGSIFEANYAIVSRLGEGGMGFVYKATQLSLKRTVAIKLLHWHSLGDEDSRKRFQREGKNLSVLRHPNITSFYQFGITNAGVPYMVMEFIEGEDLSRVLAKENCLPWQLAVNLTRQICDAMEAAHAKKIINRDIKPSNLIIANRNDDPQVKIIDFGLSGFSKNTAETTGPIDPASTTDQKLTSTGTLIGSAMYMSPEQCQGQPCIVQSDIYSLGCVLYEMLTGNVPFEATSTIGLLHKHIHELAPRFDERSDGKTFPAGLEKCVFKAMAKNPADRYGSMAEFSADLKLVQNVEGDKVSADTQVVLNTPALRAEATRKKLNLLITAGVSMALLLAGVAIFRETVVREIDLLPLRSGLDVERINKSIDAGYAAIKEERKENAFVFCSFAHSLVDTEKLPASEKAKYLSQLAEIAFDAEHKAEACDWATKGLISICKSVKDSHSEILTRQDNASLKKVCDVLLKSGGVGRIKPIAAQLMELDNKLRQNQQPDYLGVLSLNRLLLKYHQSSFGARDDVFIVGIRTASLEMQCGNKANGLKQLRALLREPRVDKRVLQGGLVNVARAAFVNLSVLEEIERFELAQKDPRPEVLVPIYFSFGKIHVHAGNYRDSSKYFQKMFKLILDNHRLEWLDANSIMWSRTAMSSNGETKELFSLFKRVLAEYDLEKMEHNDGYGALVEQLYRMLPVGEAQEKWIDEYLQKEEDQKSPKAHILALCYWLAAENCLEKDQVHQAELAVDKTILLQSKTPDDMDLVYRVSDVVGALSEYYLKKGIKTDAVIELNSRALDLLRTKKCRNDYKYIRDLKLLATAYKQEHRSQDEAMLWKRELTEWEKMRLPTNYSYYAGMADWAFRAYLAAGQEADALALIDKMKADSKASEVEELAPVLTGYKMRIYIYDLHGDKEGSAKELAAFYKNLDRCKKNEREELLRVVNAEWNDSFEDKIAKMRKGQWF